MKKIIAVCCLGLMFVASCKKKDTELQANTFKIGSTTFTSVRTVSDVLGEPLGQKGYVITATNALYNPQTNMSFKIHNLPFSSGKYQVIGNALPLGNDQIQVSTLFSATGDSYLTTGGDNVFATVSIINDKISISLPAAWALRTGTTNDSMQLTANVSEK